MIERYGFHILKELLISKILLVDNELNRVFKHVFYLPKLENHLFYAWVKLSYKNITTRCNKNNYNIKLVMELFLWQKFAKYELY
jgi:hypothetical protein